MIRQNTTANFCPSFTAIVDSAKADGITIFGVGVYLASLSEMMALVTTIPGGVPTRFVPDYTSIQFTVNPLVLAICLGIDISLSNELILMTRWC
jgi:hypothetical protein